MEEYKVNVGGRIFHFSVDSLTRDSPNLLTEHLLSVSESQDENEIFFDRDPEVFEFIAKHLRGYNIFPLIKENLPLGWNLYNFIQCLTQDACFFKLKGLFISIRPFYYFSESLTAIDIFSREEKMVFNLQKVEPTKLHIENDDVMHVVQGKHIKAEFFAGNLVWDLISDNNWEFKFLNNWDNVMVKRISKEIRPQADPNVEYYAGESSGAFFSIDDIEMNGNDVYEHTVERSFSLQQTNRPFSCVRIWLKKLVFSLRIPNDPDKPLIIVPVWGIGLTQIYHKSLKYANFF
ncbi:BTB domain protein [Gigaspora margarita]|uniref:BTB domain protein n=2 Tax=Gigaspora margarita TaxID=4874 RepID=A0A8H3WZ88_GIGMA|nr:BTB domain protein [Gigaspora margarita]